MPPKNAQWLADQKKKRCEKSDSPHERWLPHTPAPPPPLYAVDFMHYSLQGLVMLLATDHIQHCGIQV
jgi:hypothetical protein